MIENVKYIQFRALILLFLVLAVGCTHLGSQSSRDIVLCKPTGNNHILFIEDIRDVTLLDRFDEPLNIDGNMNFYKAINYNPDSVESVTVGSNYYLQWDKNNLYYDLSLGLNSAYDNLLIEPGYENLENIYDKVKDSHSGSTVLSDATEYPYEKWYLIHANYYDETRLLDSVFEAKVLAIMTEYSVMNGPETKCSINCKSSGYCSIFECIDAGTELKSIPYTCHFECSDGSSGDKEGKTGSSSFDGYMSSSEVAESAGIHCSPNLIWKDPIDFEAIRAATNPEPEVIELNQ